MLTDVRERRTQAKPMGGDQRSRVIEAQADLIRRTYEAKPELLLHELRARLAERGLRVGVSSLSRFSTRHGITRKKHRPHGRAGSGGREGGAPYLVRKSARSRPRQARVPGRDRNQHEDGAPLRAGAARERCRIAVPHGHWKTITVTAELRANGLTATALFDGPGSASAAMLRRPWCRP